MGVNTAGKDLVLVGSRRVISYGDCQISLSCVKSCRCFSPVESLEVAECFEVVNMATVPVFRVTEFVGKILPARFYFSLMGCTFVTVKSCVLTQDMAALRDGRISRTGVARDGGRGLVKYLCDFLVSVCAYSWDVISEYFPPISPSFGLISFERFKLLQCSGWSVSVGIDRFTNPDRFADVAAVLLFGSEEACWSALRGVNDDLVAFELRLIGEDVPSGCVLSDAEFGDLLHRDSLLRQSFIEMRFQDRERNLVENPGWELFDVG